MENPDGATEAGSLELGLSTAAGSSYKTFIGVYVVQFAVSDALPLWHIPKF